MARHILPSMLIPGLLAAAMSSGFAADPVKIRVASVSVPPSMHTLYMQVAYEEGIYRRNGLQVDDILQMNSGPLVTQALAAGRVDVADTDAEGVLNAAAAGFQLVAVSAPAQYLSYLIMVQPEIKTLKDLAGKPFAISRPGALSQYLMFPVLERAASHEDRHQLGPDRRPERTAAGAGQQPRQGRAAASRLRAGGAARQQCR